MCGESQHNKGYFQSIKGNSQRERERDGREGKEVMRSENRLKLVELN